MRKTNPPGKRSCKYYDVCGSPTNCQRCQGYAKKNPQKRQHVMGRFPGMHIHAKGSRKVVAEQKSIGEYESNLSKCPSQCANEDTFECSKCVEYSHFKPKKARKNPSDKDVVMANGLWSFKDEPAESYFSHSSCDFCDSGTSGSRYDITFCYDAGGEIYEASICEDCVQDIAGTRKNPPGHYCQTQCQYCFKWHPSMYEAVTCCHKEKQAQMRKNPQSHLKGRCSHCDRLVMKCDNGKCEERFVAFNNIWCNGKEHYCLKCAKSKGMM